MQDLPADETPPSTPPDWSLPKPEHLAKPTWWPASLAFGITLTTWGLVTSSIIFAMGILVVSTSIAGWIGDILNERKQH